MAFDITKIGNIGSGLNGIDFRSWALKALVWILIGLMAYGVYYWYQKDKKIKYIAHIRRDGNRLLKLPVTQIVESGNNYYMVPKLKQLVIGLDQQKVLYPSGVGLFGNSKPILDLYQDKEGNLHFCDFIKDKPLYNENGEIIERRPLVKPVQTIEAKAIWHEYYNSINKKYTTEDKFLKTAGGFILMAAIVGALIIIVATKL